MGIAFECDRAARNMPPNRLAAAMVGARTLQRGFLADAGVFAPYRGWVDPVAAAGRLDALRDKAAEIRETADIFVIVGVGGSNQAARSVLNAVPVRGAPEILYAGNNLSPDYLDRLLARLEGRKVYVNVIAKDFSTLEPGAHYRVLRQHLARNCGKKELAERFILTGTPGAEMDRLARENGNLFLDFPKAVIGRFSAMTPVGLFPMAAGGFDIDRLLAGARDMAESIAGGEEGPARYAAMRNLLLREGFRAELLASFEPRLASFGGWWLQLFGECEGKDGLGILPVRASYTEELHALGQFMQHGSRLLMETFLSVKDPGAGVTVPSDPGVEDGFAYLDGKDFAEINRVAEESVIDAHDAGGVPCMRLTMDRIDEYHFGQLFQFCLVACTVSAMILGVPPFEQSGVAEYKRRMFAALDKPADKHRGRKK